MIFDYVLNIVNSNTSTDYLYALAIFVVSIIFLIIFKYIILARLKVLSKKTKTDLDDLLVDIVCDFGWFLYLPIAFYLSLHYLVMPAFIDKFVSLWLFFAFVYYCVLSIMEFVNYGTQKFVDSKKKEDKDYDSSIIDLIKLISKVVLWAFAIVMILSNLGYNVSALVAGLGIGGIAIAFALQNVLVDIFSSFSIYFDRPFKKGDYIVIGSDSGIVEKIGIKTTRIRTLQGQELIVANKELTETRVNNFGNMKKRRIVNTFGITYSTPIEKVKIVPKIIKEILSKSKDVTINRVHFKEFGAYSLNFEVVYFVEFPDYQKYMDLQESFNLELMEKFEKEGISFAFPTQSIILEK